ncbi:uncharacterized protein LOC118435088 [Folsomia candida]|nr:uncharacterized protein LOC118435088 [Folsomia candida]
MRYKCELCSKSFPSASKLNRHDGYRHALVPLLKPLRRGFKERRSPLIPGNGFIIRDLLPRDLGHPTSEQEQEWIFEWLTVRMRKSVDVYAANGSCVYVAGVLGPKYHRGQDILNFITENPEELSLYFGRDMGSISVDVHPHHRDMDIDSPLRQPHPNRHDQFLDVVFFGRRYVEGNFQERMKLVRQLEAKYIEMALTDAEFEPVPGVPQYKVLNQRRERQEMVEVGDDKIRQVIRRGVKGVTFLCLKQGCVDPNCNAYIHPDWKSDLTIDLTRRRRGMEEEDDDRPGTGSSADVDSEEDEEEMDIDESGSEDDDDDEDMDTDSSEDHEWSDKSQPEPGVVSVKIPRPINPHDIILEVDRRFQEFKEKTATYDPTHTVYTVITTSNDEFDATKSGRRMCREVIKRQDESQKIGCYTGANSKEQEADYHNGHPHSSINKSIRTNRTAIRISTTNFPTRTLARKEEALRLLHGFLHMRFRAKGISFDILNHHMEWQWLSLCSEEEIKRSIRLAWLGIPPVVFEELSEDLKFEHGHYPVNLSRQVLDGEIKKIE